MAIAAQLCPRCRAPAFSSRAEWCSRCGSQLLTIDMSRRKLPTSLKILIVLGIIVLTPPAIFIGCDALLVAGLIGAAATHSTPSP